MGSGPALRWVVVGVLAAVGVAASLLGLRACAEGPDGELPADGPAGRDASAVGDAAPSGPDARARSAGRRAKASAEDPPDAAPTVTGTVRVVVVAAAEGTPIAGAEVTLHPGATPRRVMTTDARGTAVLPFHATDGGQCDVGVRARGFLACFRNVARKTGEEASVEARLERGAVVEVRVLDPEGRPVAGTEIGLSSYLNGPEDWTQTDVDGSAALTVAPEAPYGLCVPSPAGFVRREELIRSGPIGGRPVRHVVRLERAVRIVGAVTAPDGAIVSAIVSIRREDSGTSSGEMRCDGEGKFEFENLGAGRAWVVVATASNWSESEPTRAVEVGPGELRADPVLRPPCVVVVRTVDESGEPVVAEQVMVLHSWSALHTAGGGTDHRVAAQPGPCLVHARAPGRVPSEIEHDLVPGETWDATVRLVPGASLRGVVVDPDGGPLESANVGVERVLTIRGIWVEVGQSPRGIEDWDSWSFMAASRTDEDGSFELRGLTSGRHTVHVSPFAGFEDAVFPDVTAPSEGLRFVVERSSRLRFRVRFEGDPPADDLPSMIEIDGTTAAGTRWSSQQSRRQDGAPQDVTVPRDARPEFTISASGYAPQVVEAPVPRGEVLEIPPVRLLPGLTIAGTLRYSSGGLAPSESIRATQQRWPARIVGTQTTNDGRFSLAGLAPGRALVEVLPENLPRATFDVEVGSGRPLELTLPPYGVVWVRVAAPDGGPEPGVAVSALGPDGRPLRWAEGRTTDADGSVTLRLAPGRARIDVGGLIRTEADVRADDVTEVRVTLPR